MAVNKRKIGTDYEKKAAKYLSMKGYRILQMNYQNRFGELDILAEDKDGTLVVCEVKYRSDSRYGNPLEAVTETKKKRICKAVRKYYMEHGLSMDHSCRFDVVGICGDGSIQHIEDAFDFIW